jgi:hypothetical protein
MAPRVSMRVLGAWVVGAAVVLAAWGMWLQVWRLRPGTEEPVVTRGAWVAQQQSAGGREEGRSWWLGMWGAREEKRREAGQWLQAPASRSLADAIPTGTEQDSRNLVEICGRGEVWVEVDGGLRSGGRVSVTGASVDGLRGVGGVGTSVVLVLRAADGSWASLGARWAEDVRYEARTSSQGAAESAGACSAHCASDVCVLLCAASSARGGSVVGGRAEAREGPAAGRGRPRAGTVVHVLLGSSARVSVPLCDSPLSRAMGARVDVGACVHAPWERVWGAEAWDEWERRLSELVAHHLLLGVERFWLYASGAGGWDSLPAAGASALQRLHRAWGAARVSVHGGLRRARPAGWDEGAWRLVRGSAAGAPRWNATIWAGEEGQSAGARAPTTRTATSMSMSPAASWTSCAVEQGAQAEWVVLLAPERRVRCAETPRTPPQARASGLLRATLTRLARSGEAGVVVAAREAHALWRVADAPRRASFGSAVAAWLARNATRPAPAGPARDARGGWWGQWWGAQRSGENGADGADVKDPGAFPLEPEWVVARYAGAAEPVALAVRAGLDRSVLLIPPTGAARGVLVAHDRLPVHERVPDVDGARPEWAPNRDPASAAFAPRGAVRLSPARVRRSAATQEAHCALDSLLPASRHDLPPALTSSHVPWNNASRWIPRAPPETAADTSTPFYHDLDARALRSLLQRAGLD